MHCLLLAHTHTHPCTRTHSRTHRHTHTAYTCSQSGWRETWPGQYWAAMSEQGCSSVAGQSVPARLLLCFHARKHAHAHTQRVKAHHIHLYIYIHLKYPICQILSWSPEKYNNMFCLQRKWMYRKSSLFYPDFVFFFVFFTLCKRPVRHPQHHPVDVTCRKHFRRDETNVPCHPSPLSSPWTPPVII